MPMFTGLCGAVRSGAEGSELIRNQQVVRSTRIAGSNFLSQSIDSTDARIGADPIDPLTDPVLRQNRYGTVLGHRPRPAPKDVMNIQSRQ